jgi:hypothetical protein
MEYIISRFQLDYLTSFASLDARQTASLDVPVPAFSDWPACYAAAAAAAVAVSC